jgi:hypothetical protein
MRRKKRRAVARYVSILSKIQHGDQVKALITTPDVLGMSSTVSQVYIPIYPSDESNLGWFDMTNYEDTTANLTAIYEPFAGGEIRILQIMGTHSPVNVTINVTTVGSVEQHRLSITGNDWGIGNKAFTKRAGCNNVPDILYPSNGFFVANDEFSFHNWVFKIGSVTATPGEDDSSSTGSDGDPHLHFAHGGAADFRGKNDTFYALLSAPGVHFAARTEDTSFLLPRPQLVHGSFWKTVEWVLHGTSGTKYGVRSWAHDVGFTVYNLSDEKSAMIKTYIGVWKEWWQDDIRVFYKQSTIYTRVNGWEMNATRHPVYLMVDWTSAWRFDIAIRKLDGTVFEKKHGAASVSCFPHGLVGQSWDGDNVAVFGKMDDYTFHKDHPVVRTTSMAEGSIEGTADNYVVNSFDTDFRFSRFSERPDANCAAREVTKLMGVKVRKKTIEEKSYTTDL